MATDSVMGLFATPEQLQQQQYQQAFDRNLQLAKLNPRERNVAMFGTSVDRLGSAVGGALGGGDPQLQMATLRQQLAQGKDLTSSAGWAAYAQELQAKGDLQGAAQAAQKSTEIQSGAELKQAKLEQAKELRTQQDAAAMERLQERLRSEERMNMNTNETRSMIAQLAASMKATKGEVADDKAATRIGQNTVFDNLITEGTGLVSEIDKNKDAFSLSGRGTAAFQSIFNPEAPEVRVKSNVDSYLNKARNAYLLAAKGTQTEGDAQRAWSEFAGSLDFSSAAGAKRSVERITKELGTQKAANESYLRSRGLRSEGQSSRPTKTKKWSDL